MDTSKATITSNISGSGSLIVTGLEEIFLTDSSTDNISNYSTIVIKAVEGLTQLYLELAMGSDNDMNNVKPKVMLSFTEIENCNICA